MFRQLTHRRIHIIDLPAHVVESFTKFIEMLRKRVLARQGLHELESHVSHIEVGEPHPRALQHFAIKLGQSQAITVKTQGTFGIPNNDGDVIHFFEHVAN